MENIDISDEINDYENIVTLKLMKRETKFINDDRFCCHLVLDVAVL